MIRTTIKPRKRTVTVNVPKSYLGKKIEVLMFAIDEIETNATASTSKKKPSDFAGTISKKSAEAISKHVTKSRNEWQRDI